jgi:hypothetical protein
LGSTPATVVVGIAAAVPEVVGPSLVIVVAGAVSSSSPPPHDIDTNATARNNDNERRLARFI